MASSEHSDAPGIIAASAQSEAHDLLVSRLRDIHLPDAVSESALSVGAWWAICILATLLGIAGLMLWLRRDRHQPAKIARRMLEKNFKHWRHGSSHADYLQQSNIVLKRLALTTTNRESVARLNGEEWIDWLNQSSMRQLTDATTHALTHDCYRAKPSADIALVHQELLHWLSSYTRKNHA